MKFVSFYINPVFPWWACVVALVITFSFLLWKERQRPHRFLTLRLIALASLFVSLMGLVLRPGWRGEQTSSGIILLTPSYKKNQVDSILNNKPQLSVWTINEAEDYQHAKKITKDEQLREMAHRIEFVLGEGLQPDQLELADYRFEFLKGDDPPGIVKVDIRAKYKRHREEKISGEVNNRGVTTIRLLGPAGVEDSVALKGEGVQDFSLAFNPKQAGLFSYQVECVGGIRSRDVVPVWVEEEKKLKVLIVHHFPMAETRYLKNYLAERGHAVTLRYQTSKNTFNYEFANYTAASFSRITENVLDPYDLVITDAVTLENVAADERRAISNSIRKGLGCLLLPDLGSEKFRQWQEVADVVFRKTSKDTARIQLSKAYTFFTAGLECDEGKIEQELKNGSQTLSGYRAVGLGAIGFQFLRETYRLALEGHGEDYARLWAPLIEKVAKPHHEPVRITSRNLFPTYPNETLTLQVVSGFNAHPVLKADSVVVPLREDIFIDNCWHGKFWFTSPGWHMLRVDSVQKPFYVSDQGWPSVRKRNQQLLNERISAADFSEEQRTEKFEQPISLVWFYVLFVLSAGFLWLAPKL